MPTSPSSSAQEARKAIAERLKEIRLESELTAIELAQRAGWERTKVSKIEHAARPPSVADIRVWCRVCNAENQTEDLLAALRAAAGMHMEWKRVQRSGMRRLQEQRNATFEQTLEFRLYTSQVVPGILQVPKYARAVMTAAMRQAQAANDLDEAIAAQMKRAHLLREGNHRFAIVMEETVLHYRLGGSSVLAEQLEHLLTVMRFPSVSIAIIPFDASRNTYALGDFSIYDDSEVRVELLTAGVSVTAPTEIAMYRREFELLASMAVTGTAARALIGSALGSLR